MYYACTVPECPEGEQGGVGLLKRVAGEARQGQGVEGKTCVWDEVSLDSVVGSHELDQGAPRFQLSGHAQRGDSVSSRAAPCYQHSWPPEV